MRKLETIYSHMQDDMSKALFCKRLLFNCTQEDKYLNEMIELTMDYCKQEEKKIYPFLCRVKDTTGKVIVYGAGSGGRLIKKYLDYLGIKIMAYCDANTDKQTEYCGVPVISPERLLREYAEEYVLICVFNPYINEEIYNNLIRGGCTKEKMIIAADFFGKQYFDETIPIPPIQEGCFVDAGCYDLGTALEYRRWNPNKEGNILSFEADENSYRKCRRILEQMDDSYISILPYGVWKNDDTLRFQIGNNGTTRLADGLGGGKCKGSSYRYYPAEYKMRIY